jgi:hypothetical protein
MAAHTLFSHGRAHAVRSSTTRSRCPLSQGPEHV